jgi:hypothetical protein
MSIGPACFRRFAILHYAGWVTIESFGFRAGRSQRRRRDLARHRAGSESIAFDGVRFLHRH